MKRFDRPRLVTFDDPAYQQHVAQQMLQRANQRATRPPAQRDLFGGEAETLLRAALAERFELSERRILEYEERKGRAWQRKYRELDALVVEGQARVHVFEIKASRRPGALHRALRQLRDTRAILELAFRAVSTSVLVVDTGMLTEAGQAELAAERAAQGLATDRLPQTLAEAIAEHEDVRQVADLAALSAFPAATELVVLSVDDIIALAAGAPLSLDWEADEIEPEDEPEPPPTAVYSTPDEEEESPLAAALRKAADGQRRNPGT